LSSPLIERGLYKISFSIKTSNKYGSDKEPVFNFADFPLILSIYGCSESCKETELLIETNPVENIDDWLRCDYILHPKRSYEILKLEVRNIDKYPTPYGGNILIDDISDIEVIDTATRIPVSINNQLISLINISARSAKDLDNLIYELIEISKEHNISLQIPNFELIKSIYLSRVVEENLRNQDIRFYLMSIDDNSLREALHSLNLIGYQEMKLIIERGYMLIKKSKDGNISEDELLEFNNLPKEIQDLESGEKYRIEIINSNYDEIVEQLKYCR
jgi:transcriptional regulator